MTATELLYRRALQAIEGKSGLRVAVINAQIHPLLVRLLTHVESYQVLQHYKPKSDALSNAGFVPSLELEGSYHLIVIIPTKNKKQTLAWMADASDCLCDHGMMMGAAANIHGGKSYGEALKLLAGNGYSESKSKCRVFVARDIGSWDQVLRMQWQQAGKIIRMEEYGLFSQPGLFSWNRADPGSQLLLQYLPRSLEGVGMDLCCGYGLLASSLLPHHPNIQHLHLVDADRLAIQCATKNTDKYRSKSTCHWLDAVADPLPNHLDWVVCNPPFHEGQLRSVELGEQIIARACRLLKPGGKLYLVANRKLPYEFALTTNLKRVTTLVQRDHFKVIEGVA
ncbi:MAG: methyltransferase [Mariprofundaceae bacterium]